jgi:two-component system NtrC family sensor kinase
MEDGRRRGLVLGLAARLAILTAVLAIGLVLTGNQIALTWSQRLHMEEDRREATSIATTLASYLMSIAPAGDLDSLAGAFAEWDRSDISGADARVYVLVGDNLAPITVGDETTPPPPDALAVTAFTQRAMQVAFRGGSDAAWHLAVPLGETAPYGVLSVTVATQRLADLAAERHRTYLLAIASALLVALSVAWLTARWVGRPLRELGRAMAQAHGGPGPAPGAPEIGPREFRLVARRYNDLLHALTDRERESAARAALLALEERARSYDRMAVTAETAAELAHEIGTPLSTMRGHIQLLRNDLTATGQAGAGALERISSLLAQLDRVTAIVRAELERGAWPQPSVTTVNLADVAGRLLRFLEPSLDQARVRAELHADGAEPGRPVLARADPALVEQILLNLIKNAIEALPPGGSVRITTGADQATAFIVVADDGPGLSPEAQAYLFNPFTTTKGPAGTGLGLVVSRRLARVLGGELAYVPGERGTTWRVTLPLAGDPRRTT